MFFRSFSFIRSPSFCNFYSAAVLAIFSRSSSSQRQYRSSSVSGRSTASRKDSTAVRQACRRPATSLAHGSESWSSVSFQTQSFQSLAVVPCYPTGHSQKSHNISRHFQLSFHFRSSVREVVPDTVHPPLWTESSPRPATVSNFLCHSTVLDTVKGFLILIRRPFRLYFHFRSSCSRRRSRHSPSSVVAVMRSTRRCQDNEPASTHTIFRLKPTSLWHRHIVMYNIHEHLYSPGSNPTYHLAPFVLKVITTPLSCTLPSITCFLRTYVSPHRHLDRINRFAYTAAKAPSAFEWGGANDPQKSSLPLWELLPHLTHGSLGPTESAFQTASWSVQPFLQGSRTYSTHRPTDRHTDRPHYSVCSNRALTPAIATMRIKMRRHITTSRPTLIRTLRRRGSQLGQECGEVIKGRFRPRARRV